MNPIIIRENISAYVASLLTDDSDLDVLEAVGVQLVLDIRRLRTAT